MDPSGNALATQDAVYPFIGKKWSHKLVVILAAAIPFALTVFAVVRLWGAHVTWLDLTLLAVGHTVVGLGISLGYHRLVAHNAFQARAPVRFVLFALAAGALQGGPASWAATHRRHHALSDKPGDPHSPLEGLWHAHFGWLQKGNLVHTGPAHERLMKDPMIRFFERTWLAWVVASFLVPGLIAWTILGGGHFWQGVLWGGAVRVFLVHHTTWSINSICHTFGTRPYRSPDVARNNALFGIFGFGEGWHNNHHAFPNSAYIGHRWWQVDIGKYVLWMLRPLRLVRNLHIPTREDRMARMVRRPRKRPTAS